MRLYLISDNTDTATGMRLAGIEGIVASNENEAAEALEIILREKDVAIILINRNLCEKCESLIKDFRRAHSLPVIVEIPDKNSTGAGKSLSNYIRETVGIDIQ